MHEDELLTDPLYIRLSLYRKMVSFCRNPQEAPEIFFGQLITNDPLELGHAILKHTDMEPARCW
jgi:hypothetical protein